MHVLVAAFLLLIPCAFQQSNPAAPAANPSVGKRNGQTEADHIQQNPTSPAPSVDCFPIQTPHTDAKHGDPYDPRNDSVYRAYLWFTILGVIGGLGGIGVLIRQSSLLRESVNAAHKSADALMDAEAAFLSVNVKDTIMTSDASKTLIGYRIYNLGRTTAIVFAAEALLQVGDDTDNPPMPSLYEDKTTKLPSDFYIPAGKDSPSTTFLSTVNEPMVGIGNKTFHLVRLTEKDDAQIINTTKALWSYGFVRYADIFKRTFELRFCHRYEPKLTPNGGFLVAGPPEFNRLTRYAEAK